MVLATLPNLTREKDYSKMKNYLEKITFNLQTFLLTGLQKWL